MMDDLRKLLASYRFNFNSEKELQDGIEKALTDHGIEFSREHPLSKKDRIDFLLHDGRGIEVKLDGSANQLASQVKRYLDQDVVKGLLVVVSRSRLADLPETLNGKPIVVHLVRRL